MDLTKDQLDEMLEEVLQGIAERDPHERFMMYHTVMHLLFPDPYEAFLASSAMGLHSIKSISKDQKKLVLDIEDPIVGIHKLETEIGRVFFSGHDPRLGDEVKQRGNPGKELTAEERALLRMMPPSPMGKAS